MSSVNKPYGRDICRVLPQWGPGEQQSTPTRELRKVTAEPGWVGIIELGHGKLQEKHASARGNSPRKSTEETGI